MRGLQTWKLSNTTTMPCRFFVLLSLFVMFIALYHRNSLFEYVIWFHISGYVPDRCGCCQICARLEHELCDISPEDNKYGICGENLECRSRNFDGGVHYKFRYFWVEIISSRKILWLHYQMQISNNRMMENTHACVRKIKWFAVTKGKLIQPFAP